MMLMVIKTHSCSSSNDLVGQILTGISSKKLILHFKVLTDIRKSSCSEDVKQSLVSFWLSLTETVL